MTIYDSVTNDTYELNAQHHLESGLKGLKARENRLKDFKVFEKAAINLHGAVYTYLDYNYPERKVTYRVNETGKTYTQNIYEHLKGKSKQECMDNTFKEFVRKAKLIHNSSYEYSDFVSTNLPVTVTNVTTGKTYKQRIQHILSGKKPQKDLCKYSKESFQIQSNLVHNNRFICTDYIDLNKMLTVYDTVTEMTFKQSAHSHLAGSLPKELSYSNTSKPEYELKKRLLALYPQCSVIEGYRPAFLKRKELDLYVPELNLAIEYNGLIYHHSSTEHSSKFLRSTAKHPKYHLEKSTLCFENGINLLHIFEHEYQSLNIDALIKQYATQKIASITNVEVFIDKKTLAVIPEETVDTLSVYVPVVTFIEPM